MLDVAAEHLRTLLGILAQHVPQADVLAFGSRTTGEAAPWSDLDLVVRADERIELQDLGELRDALQRSSLPFRVDISDWHRVSESFRAVIADGAVVVRRGTLPPQSPPTPSTASGSTSPLPR